MIESNNYNPQEGDVIEWAGDRFLVIENYGENGTVAPLGSKKIMSSFYWQTENYSSKFIRKATYRELEKIGLIK